MFMSGQILCSYDFVSLYCERKSILTGDTAGQSLISEMLVCFTLKGDLTGFQAVED